MKHSLPALHEGIKKISQKRGRLIQIAKKAGVHCVVYDGREATTNYQRFVRAFKEAGIIIHPFYALKSNSYSKLLKDVVSCGGGLDVSSPRELDLALKARARNIVFTGPGKTEAILKKILSTKGPELTVHLESITELKTLGRLTARTKKAIRCGIRVVPSTHESWSKFGIPLQELKSFLVEAKKYPAITISGLQFHCSYVKDSKPYTRGLSEIAQYAQQFLTKSQRDAITCIDIGGGFYPQVIEGEYPWNKKGYLYYDEPGLHENILRDKYQPRALAISVTPLESIARDIARVWLRKVKDIFPNAELWAEPGRFISHSTMHFLFTVVDKKTPQKSIVDGGWNSVGWERYQYLHYAPIFNLSKYDPEKEFPHIVYGNLCLPDDIWGYYVRGAGIEVGDILCMPFQGAYSFTYAQEFIRGIPPVINL